MALAAVNPTAGITSAIPVANFTVSSDSASSVNRTPTAPVVPVVSSSDGITHSVVSSKPTVVDRIAVVTSAPVDVTMPVAASSVVSPVNGPRAVAASPVVTNTQTEDILLFEGIGGKYTVQVGAFDRLEKAESLRSQLAKKYDMVFVEKSITGKTPYRVRVGRFPDRQAARQIEKKLADSGIETYLTTLN